MANPVVAKNKLLFRSFLVNLVKIKSGYGCSYNTFTNVSVSIFTCFNF